MAINQWQWHWFATHVLKQNFILWNCFRCYSSRNILSLQDRGIFKSVFPDIRIPDFEKHLCSSSRCIYAGFDPTADSLHIGNLLVLIALIHCQRAGHNILTLVGGATGRIGDPCGRQNERDQMSQSDVLRNVKGILKNIKNIFTNHELHLWKQKDHLPEAKILNNIEWYKNIKLIDFLADKGRMFRIGKMLRKDSVQSRKKSPDGISFTEFTYQIFQAYDWLHLYNEYKCSVQIGGHDQLGNIVAGYDLINDPKGQVFGLTVPLVTTSSGEKLGKSAGNSVWLSETKTSPFDFYQYFINVSDADVLKYLKLFTFLPNNELEDVMNTHDKNPENRFAQKRLAEQVTLLVHGDEGLNTAKASTDVLFKNSTEALFTMSEKDLKALFKSSPFTEITLEPGVTVIDMVEAANCFSRVVDAERVIKGGGLYINQQRAINPEAVLIAGHHILPTGITLLRIGKKNNYHIIKWRKY